jgi:hypothetical protein
MKSFIEKSLITICIISFALTGSLSAYLGLMVYFFNSFLDNPMQLKDMCGISRRGGLKNLSLV